MDPLDVPTASKIHKYFVFVEIPNLTKSETSFEGFVVVSFHRLPGIDYISLHTLNLSIQSAALKCPIHRSTPPPSNCSECIPNAKFQSIKEPGGEVNTLHLAKSIGISNVPNDLIISFTGTINNVPEGLYNFGEGLATALEPLFCRSFFPCVDSPNIYATLTLSVAVPCWIDSSGRTFMDRSSSVPMAVISCCRPVDVLDGPAAKLPDVCHAAASAVGYRPKASPTSTTQNNVRVTTFEETPALPPYAYGLFVGTFCRSSLFVKRKFGDNGLSREFPISLLLPANCQKENCDFKLSLQMAVEAFEFFSNFFDLNPPLSIDKLDLIGLPIHRGLGLENFGCLSFDLQYLQSPTINLNSQFVLSHKLRTCRLICHEVCHLWIGDAVAPSSFDQVWLKEGVARFLEFVALENIFSKSFDSEFVWSLFVVEILFEAMLMEVPNGTETAEATSARLPHPVEVVGLSSTSQVVNHFDATTYGKAAAVLRMLDDFFGGCIKSMITRLTQKYLFTSITSDDFWELARLECPNAHFEPVCIPRTKSLPTFDGSPAAFLGSLGREWMTTVGLPHLRIRILPNEKVWEIRIENNSIGPLCEVSRVPLVMEINGENRKLLIDQPESFYHLSDSLDVPIVVFNPSHISFIAVTAADVNTFTALFLPGMLRPVECMSLIVDILVAVAARRLDRCIARRQLELIAEKLSRNDKMENFLWSTVEELLVVALTGNVSNVAGGHTTTKEYADDLMDLVDGIDEGRRSLMSPTTVQYVRSCRPL